MGYLEVRAAEPCGKSVPGSLLKTLKDLQAPGLSELHGGAGPLLGQKGDDRAQASSSSSGAA